MAKPIELKQPTPAEMEKLRRQVEAMDHGLEAGALGPLDYLGGGAALKNMYNWGKNLYKTFGTVSKDLARHPNKKWIESFNRWDHKPRGAYKSPQGAKQATKAVATPIVLGAAAGGSKAYNENADYAPEFTKEDLASFDELKLFDDPVVAPKPKAPVAPPVVAPRRAPAPQVPADFDFSGVPNPVGRPYPESAKVANPYSMNPFASNFSPAAFGVTTDAINASDARHIPNAAAYQAQQGYIPKKRIARDAARLTAAQIKADPLSAF